MRSNLGFTWPGPRPNAYKLARFPGTSGDYASTPDNAAFSALTDFSVAALVSLDDWTPAANNTVLGHFSTTGDQRSHAFQVRVTGELRLNLSTTGTGSTGYDSVSTVGFTDGTPHWILVTRASASGEIKFYTADYTAGVVTPPAIGSFTQLGSTVSGMTGALYNATTTLDVSGFTGGTTASLDGDVRRVMLYTGIYGSGTETLVRDFYPSDAATTAVTSWTSSVTGETWTLNGGDVTLVSA